MSADVKGLSSLVAKFQKIRDELASGGGPAGGTATRVLREMGGLDAKQNVQVFARETNPNDGAKWQTLSPKYAAWKRRNSKSRKLLVLGGQMRRSLTAPSDPLRVVRLSGNTLTLGTTHELASYHVTGNAHLPKRPMVGKTEAQLGQQGAAWLKIVLDRIGSVLGGPAGIELKDRAQQLRPDPRAW